ncbi:MAG: hypothetical protein ACKO6N_22660 [Myxococcota bacterium]
MKYSLSLIFMLALFSMTTLAQAGERLPERPRGNADYSGYGSSTTTVPEIEVASEEQEGDEMAGTLEGEDEQPHGNVVGWIEEDP